MKELSRLQVRVVCGTFVDVMCNEVVWSVKVLSNVYIYTFLSLYLSLFFKSSDFHPLLFPDGVKYCQETLL
jgi:hypothetical protein